MCHPYMDNTNRNACDGTIIYSLIPPFDMHTKSSTFKHAFPHPTHTHTHTY